MDNDPIEPLTMIANGDELWVFGKGTSELRQWFTRPGVYASPWQAFLWRIGLRKDEPPLRIWEHYEVRDF